LDHPALWGIDASLEELEELRKKVRDAAKYAVPKSKVAWSNIIATRYRGAAVASIRQVAEKG